MQASVPAISFSLKVAVSANSRLFFSEVRLGVWGFLCFGYTRYMPHNQHKQSDQPSAGQCCGRYGGTLHRFPCTVGLAW